MARVPASQTNIGIITFSTGMRYMDLVSMMETLIVTTASARH